MEEINASSIKKIFDDAQAKGMFYPELYVMIMMAYYCGIKRGELVDLKIGDLAISDMKARIMSCGGVLTTYLQGLKKKGNFVKGLPLFPRYYGRNAKKIYEDFEKVCLCSLPKTIKYNDIVHAGMREFYDGLEKYELSKKQQYKIVAKQYGFNDPGSVGTIVNDRKKSYQTNVDRLEFAEQWMGRYIGSNDLTGLKKAIWAMLYYVYHRKHKKGDHPREWYVKKSLVSSYKKIKDRLSADESRDQLVEIKKIFNEIAKSYKEKLPHLTKEEMKYFWQD